MNSRAIGKFGFLLAILGFFMPVACDRNAFQLIEYVDSTSSFFIIALFVLAIIGFVIGLLLLLSKTHIPSAIDWIIIIASVCMGIGLLRKNELNLQYGAYIIISGFAIAILFQFISLAADKSPTTNNISNINKKCPFCANDIKREATFCQFCGKELPKEQNIVSADEQNIANSNNNSDKSSMGFSILGFFIPLVGLILWLVWKKEFPLKAKSCGIGALIGFIFQVVAQVIFVGIVVRGL